MDVKAVVLSFFFFFECFKWICELMVIKCPVLKLKKKESLHLGIKITGVVHSEKCNKKIGKY